MLTKIIFTDICTYQITACCETFSGTFLLRDGDEIVEMIYVKKVLFLK